MLFVNLIVYSISHTIFVDLSSFIKFYTPNYVVNWIVSPKAEHARVRGEMRTAHTRKRSRARDSDMDFMCEKRIKEYKLSSALLTISSVCFAIWTWISVTCFIIIHHSQQKKRENRTKNNCWTTWLSWQDESKRGTRSSTQQHDSFICCCVLFLFSSCS